MPDRPHHPRRPGRKRRNPYLILGVDFAAEPAEATRAFARISRRLRRGRSAEGEGGFTLEDATWALHEIEQAATDPEAALGIFRVPANPEVYEVTPGPGVVGLEPQNLTRTTPAGSTDAVVSLQAQVIDHLGRAALETTLNTLLAPYT
jgi:hypothetical protein